MYAAAKAIQKRLGNKEKIVIDDTAIKKIGWENSLVYYPLEGVEYVSDKKIWRSKVNKLSRFILFSYIHLSARFLDFRGRYDFQKKHQLFFNKHHLMLCENGYIPLPEEPDKDIILKGYFQSEQYFQEFKNEIIETFKMKQMVNDSGYPNLNKIKERNTICISIKVEHNVGSRLYDVCTREYWEKAIQYMIDHVKDPLFFICSDNVEYVLENFIDADKYDVVLQSREYPVHISLGVMSCCKHFIIGNTSFGWWAQYLSEYKEKRVIAPSRWYGLDVPCDLRQENWTTIEV